MEKFQFAISVNDFSDSTHLLLETIDNTVFEGIELKGNVFDDKQLLSHIKQYDLKLFNIVNIVESSILRSINLQRVNVQNELIKLLYSVIVNDYNICVKNFTLDFGLSNYLSNEISISQKIKFLHQLYYPLYKTNKNICLPLTIPDTHINENLKHILNVLNHIMLDNFRVSLNIFPHEIKKDFDPAGLFSELMFDMEIVRIIYEPDTGNYLTERLLEFWLNPLKNIGFEGIVVIAPGIRNIDLLHKEIDKLTTIVSKVNI